MATFKKNLEKTPKVWDDTRNAYESYSTDQLVEIIKAADAVENAYEALAKAGGDPVVEFAMGRGGLDHGRSLEMRLLPTLRHRRDVAQSIIGKRLYQKTYGDI